MGAAGAGRRGGQLPTRSVNFYSVGREPRAGESQPLLKRGFLLVQGGMLGRGEEQQLGALERTLTPRQALRATA